MRGVGEEVQAIKASKPWENSFNSLRSEAFPLGNNLAIDCAFGSDLLKTCTLVKALL